MADIAPNRIEALRDSKILIALLSVLVIFAMGIILVQMEVVLLPLVIATYLSYLFKPIVIFLRKRKVPMFIALIVVLLVVSAIIFGLSAIIYSSADAFISAVPKYQTKLEDLIGSIVQFGYGLATEFDLNVNEMDWRSALDISSITSIFTSGLGSFLNFFSNSFLILLFMMFILAATGDLTTKVERAFKDKHSLKIASIIKRIDARVRQYLITKTLISLVTATIGVIILVSIGVDFALLWGFLIFVLNFVPNIGSFLATVLPILIALLQFEGIGPAVLVAILLVSTQFAMGNVVEPRVMAFSLNLSPLLVIVSVALWAWIWGIWGMVLAVPIMSTLKIVMEHIEPLKPIAYIMGGRLDVAEAD
ncbi:MAG: hypothetical protein CL946_06820 [Ectothiorhodospiraceae bacterium]|nr:hypothetical protein [Ectothiorhodospiraceae bacterium]